MSPPAVRTLPIRLQPVAGESFDSWLFAYAARLETPLPDLGVATGLPVRFLRQPARSIALGKNLDDLDGWSHAAGVDRGDLDRLLAPLARYTDAVRVRFAGSGVVRMVAPLAWSRFCPACLASGGDRWQAAWRLGWHTTCDVHRCYLADRCPACRRHQRERPLIDTAVDPRLARCCTARTAGARDSDVCGHDLTSTSVITDTDVVRNTLAFQGAAAAILNPDAGTAARREALDVLADVLLIARRLPDDPFDAQLLAPPAAAAPVLAQSWNAYLGIAGESLGIFAPDARTPGVLPREWSAASAALTARAVSSWDTSMRPTDRLRWRSTTTTARRPIKAGLQTAKARAQQVPEALWADWAIRLTPKSGIDSLSFRLVAAASLLLPGTPGPIAGVLEGTCHHGRGRKISHVLGTIPPGDLKPILTAITELAGGLDSLGGVIDYQRRRDLAASVDLLSAGDWEHICAAARIPTRGIRTLNNARLWIYETLTGCPLHSAPPAIRPEENTLNAYHAFALRLSARVTKELEAHARSILTSRGIDEPLTWAPPRDWVQTESLPGPEPDDIDVDRVRRLIRSRRSPGSVADAVGVSLDHVRLTMRRHPQEDQPRPAPAANRPIRPRRPFPAELTAERLRHLVVDERRGARSIAAEFGMDRKTIAAAVARENIPVGPPGGRPKFVIDAEWLRAEYVERLRTLPDIASELGTTPTNLARVARKHRIPLRGRGSSSHAENLAPPDSCLPFPLSAALSGEGGTERVRRYQVIARSPSIRQAAISLGCDDQTLYAQLAKLENSCDGPLLTRHTRTHKRQELTPLGRRLVEQADTHFGRPPAAPLDGVPEPLASALASLQGAGRVQRFLTIARADSLRESARMLGAHQTRISMQVSNLEASCGGPLLQRRTSSSPQHLTDLGRLLVEQANTHLRLLG